MRGIGYRELLEMRAGCETLAEVRARISAGHPAIRQEAAHVLSKRAGRVLDEPGERRRGEGTRRFVRQPLTTQAEIRIVARLQERLANVLILYIIIERSRRCALR